MTIDINGHPASATRDAHGRFRPATAELLRPERDLVTYSHAERSSAQLYKDISGQWLATKHRALKPLYWAIGLLAIASAATALIYEGPAAVAAGSGQVIFIVLFVILAIFGIIWSGRR
jgi:uncharacterized membrane protein YtjA (UPF0391 family)